MVKHKSIIVMFVVLLSMSSVFADADVSAMTGFSTGMMIDGTGSKWISAAQARLSVSTPSSSSVKAQLSALYTLAIDGGVYKSSLALEKAYARFRLPWFSERTMRVTIGKSPLSWGYGLYFNAGDIIFGATPNVSAAVGGMGGDEYRTATTWMILVTLPFGGDFSAELVVLPDVDESKPAVTAGRLGGRLLWSPGYVPLDAMEIGYLGSVDENSHSVYIAMDGTFWFDYNLAATTNIKAGEAGASAKENFLVSLGLSKVFSIPTDTRTIPLTLRLENLYGPFAESYSGFLSLNLGVSDVAGVGIVTTCDIASKLYSDPQCTVSSFLSCTYRPIAGLVLVLQGGIVSAPIAGTRSHFGAVMLSCQYSF